MTCIVGWADETRMVMGADSAGVAGWQVAIRADRKLFRLTQPHGPDVIIGFTSSFRLGQLLMGMTLPLDEGSDPFRWMVDQFVPTARERLKDGGYMKLDSNRETGGTFLVAYRGHIFGVYDDLQVAETVEGYNAVGCGDAYALGALGAMENVAGDPEAAVRRALAIAERLSAGVRGPMHVETVELATRPSAPSSSPP